MTQGRREAVTSITAVLCAATESRPDSRAERLAGLERFDSRQGHYFYSRICRFLRLRRTRLFLLTAILTANLSQSVLHPRRSLRLKRRNDVRVGQRLSNIHQAR